MVFAGIDVVIAFVVVVVAAAAAAGHDTTISARFLPEYVLNIIPTAHRTR